MIEGIPKYSIIEMADHGRTRYLVHEIVELLVISDGNKVEISEELPPVEVDKFRIP